MVVKQKCGFLGLGTLLLYHGTLLLYELVRLADFLHVDTNLGKLSYFNNYWMGMVKNGQDLIDHVTFKSGVFDELSTLKKCFLNDDSDGIIFNFITNLLCIFDI